jgi:hypothetical protein
VTKANYCRPFAMARKWYIGGFKSAEVLSSRPKLKCRRSKQYIALMSGELVFASSLICPNPRQMHPPMLMERSVPCRRAGDIGTGSTLPKLFY